MASTPKLRDVAARAGVHPGTASRALNPATRAMVNAATARRVADAARELGYRPHNPPRALKLTRSLSVGMLIPDLTNPVYPPIVRAVEDVLGAAGYTALLANTDNDPERAAAQFASLRSRQVDGFLIATVGRDDTMVTEVVRAGVSVVLIHRVPDAQLDAPAPHGSGAPDHPAHPAHPAHPGHPGHPGHSGGVGRAGSYGAPGAPGDRQGRGAAAGHNVPTVTGVTAGAFGSGDSDGSDGSDGAPLVSAVVCDDWGGIDTAVRHLVDLGHTSIAHLAGPTTTSTGHQRALAFGEALCRYGLAADPDLVVDCGAYTEAAGERGLRTLLDRGRPFTAVVCGNDLIAIGCYTVMEERGLSCPDDISLVGFNDMPFVDKLRPPLTTVHVPDNRVGAEAARLLLERIADPGLPPRVVKLPLTFVRRGSTAPPPRAHLPRGGRYAGMHWRSALRRTDPEL